MHTLHSILCTQYSALNTLHSILCTQYSVLNTLYSILCTQYSVLSTLYSVLCTQYSVLSTLYSVPNTLHPLKHPCCPLSGSDTHGHHAVSLVSTFQFMEQLHGKFGSRAT